MKVIEFIAGHEGLFILKKVSQATSKTFLLWSKSFIYYKRKININLSWDTHFFRGKAWFLLFFNNKTNFETAAKPFEGASDTVLFSL